MDEHFESRFEQVRKWLDENVQVYATPHSVKLSGFDVDWNEFKGSFRVQLDEIVLIEKFTFSPDSSGKPAFYIPMFHSPLGAPCSYAAIELTEFTRLAIEICLKKTIPRIGSSGDATFVNIKEAQRRIESGSIFISIVEAYLEWMRIRKKCSPKALAWDKFHKFIRKYQPDNAQEKIPSPLILGGDIANGNEKLERLGEQLQFAEEYGVLDKALEYLEHLKRQEWTFCTPQDWDYIHPDRQGY